MKKNGLESIIYFMKNAISCENVPESGLQDLSVAEAAIQAQSGTYNTERDGYIILKYAIEYLQPASLNQNYLVTTTQPTINALMASHINHPATQNNNRNFGHYKAYQRRFIKWSRDTLP